MTHYADMTTAELEVLHEQLEAEYADYCAKELSLNMARGKPSPEQLELSAPMLDVLNSTSDLLAADGTDCRNYGVLTGIPEARELVGEMLGCPADQVILASNASLNVMFDTIARAMNEGVLGSTPWGQLDKVKFLCPVPGYDRHFTICEHFGIEMINIKLNDDGPDMDEVERLVESDAAIKGIWCVPKYSNPSGQTYSDEVVRRFAALKPAAEDFRIFWDNAYCVHHLSADPAEQDQLLDILTACEEAGNPDIVYEFCSTSKVTFPGAGIAAIASSPANIAALTASMNAQTIGADKLNQLRHVRFLKDGAGVAEHMAKHAEMLAPRFKIVADTLEADLTPVGVGSWTNPRGGYFITFTGPAGSAKAIVERAKNAGVQLTGAGAPFPYGVDPDDAVLRIAPSFPSCEDLALAAKIFTLCVRLVAIELLLA